MSVVVRKAAAIWPESLENEPSDTATCIDTPASIAAAVVMPLSPVLADDVAQVRWVSLAESFLQAARIRPAFFLWAFCCPARCHEAPLVLDYLGPAQHCRRGCIDLAALDVEPLLSSSSASSPHCVVPLPSLVLLPGQCSLVGGVEPFPSLVSIFPVSQCTRRGLVLPRWLADNVSHRETSSGWSQLISSSHWDWLSFVDAGACFLGG